MDQRLGGGHDGSSRGVKRQLGVLLYSSAEEQGAGQRGLCSSTEKWGGQRGWLAGRLQLGCTGLGIEVSRGNSSVNWG